MFLNAFGATHIYFKQIFSSSHFFLPVKALIRVRLEQWTSHQPKSLKALFTMEEDVPRPHLVHQPKSSSPAFSCKSPPPLAPASPGAASPTTVAPSPLVATLREQIGARNQRGAASPGAVAPSPVTTLREQIGARMKQSLEELKGEELKAKHRRVCALHSEMERKETVLSIMQATRLENETALCAARVEVVKAEQAMVISDTELQRMMPKFERAKEQFEVAHKAFKRDVAAEFG